MVEFGIMPVFLDFSAFYLFNSLFLFFPAKESSMHFYHQMPNIQPIARQFSHPFSILFSAKSFPFRQNVRE